jgi:hypothetical protein
MFHHHHDLFLGSQARTGGKESESNQMRAALETRLASSSIKQSTDSLERDSRVGRSASMVDGFSRATSPPSCRSSARDSKGLTATQRMPKGALCL